MCVVAAGSSQSPVYPVGEGAAHSPRCSRRQPCRAYPGGFNPDQHGSTFQAEPLAAALNTGYCLLPHGGWGSRFLVQFKRLQCGAQGGYRTTKSRVRLVARPLWLTAILLRAISAKVSMSV